MVFVKVSETYDLSTKVGKMGIVGIHTPRGPLFSKLWGGLISQHKKFRFASCDVTMACASMMPADPLQIGLEAGAIAPQDMFNPILYKAVSNDSMNNLINFMYSQYEASDPFSESSLVKGSVNDINDVEFETDVDQFKMYYALLADDDGWRKAMPQAGLQMKGLYPLVYQMLSPYGKNYFDVASTMLDDSGGFVGSDTGDFLVPDNASGSGVGPYTYGQGTAPLRGPSMRMPWMDTKILVSATNQGTESTVAMNVNSQTSRDTYAQVVGEYPPSYVACMILPPATLNQLYYRLKITWTIELSGLVPLTNTMTWADLAVVGQMAYGTDYATQASATAQTASMDMVDTTGADVTKVMESV